MRMAFFCWHVSGFVLLVCLRPRFARLSLTLFSWSASGCVLRVCLLLWFAALHMALFGGLHITYLYQYLYVDVISVM